MGREPALRRGIPGAFIGVDVAAEGTLIDRKGGRYSEELGLSVNLIGGIDFVHTENVQIGVGAVLGIIQVGEECPRSYLGLECYAGRAPDREYEFNGGGIFLIRLGDGVIGLRHTGNSQMLFFGLSFR